MTMGLPCDSDGYDLRIEQCRICGSRGCTKKHSCGAMTTPRDDIAGLIERLRDRTKLLGQTPGAMHNFMDGVCPLIEEAATQLYAQAAEITTLRAAIYDATEGISAACNESQLDAQAKELAALREQLESCASLAMKEGGMRTGWQARAETAERGRDALSARVKNAIHDRDNAIRLQAMLESEVEKLSARVKGLEAGTALLTNPIAVHINMCRGTIAKPSWENLRHLFPIIYDLEHADRRRIKAESRATRLQQERDEAIKLIRPLAILAEDTARVSSKHGSEFAPEMSSLAERARSFVRRLASGPEKDSPPQEKI